MSTAVRVRVLQNLQVVAEAADRRFDELEMDRRHLRAEQRVVLFHLLREDTHGCRRWIRSVSRVVALLAHAEGGDEGTDTDPCGAEVVDLIDL